jgi:hypothetical protein
MEENYDGRKIYDISKIPNSAFAKFYNFWENVATDKVIVMLKWTVIFRQYIPRKHLRFGIKLYKLCDMSGYTYDMKVHLGNESDCMAQQLTVFLATLTELELTRK